MVLKRSWLLLICVCVVVAGGLIWKVMFVNTTEHNRIVTQVTQKQPVRQVRKSVVSEKMVIPQSDIPQGPDVYVSGIKNQPIAAQLQVGAAGLYPSVSVAIDPDGRGNLPEMEIVSLGGQEMTQIEVYANSMDSHRPGAFWQEIKPLPSIADQENSEYQIQLQPAAPLRIAVVGPDGQPVPNTIVHLSRRAVHVMRLESTSDAQGFARFEQIPKGVYHATIYAPGFLRRELAMIHHDPNLPDGTPLQHVQVEPSRDVYGCVLDVDGQGAAGALIFAHIASPDSAWFGRELHTHEIVRVDGPPVEGVAQADMNGCFSITNLSAGQLYLEARTRHGQPTISPQYDLMTTTELGPVEFQMKRGHDVVVRVVDEQGRAVPNALVSWQDALSGLFGQAISDEKGLVIFSGMPLTSSVQASLKQWTSAPHALGIPDDEGDFELEVTLKAPSSLKNWVLRLNTPSVVEPTAVYIVMDAKKQHIKCHSERLNPRDWSFESCPMGQGWLHMETVQHGTWRQDNVWGRDVELNAPQPQSLELHVQGLSPDLMRQARLSWRALDEHFGWQKTKLEQTSKKPPIQTWQSALYPGSYTLKLEANHHTFDRQMVIQQTKSFESTWQIATPTAVSMHVVDVRGTPVVGAMIQLMTLGGKVLTQTTSSGHTPSVLSLKYRGKVQVLVTSPTQGEGRLMLDLSKTQVRQSQRVTLNKRLFELSYTGRIQSIDALSKILGTSIVEDGDALLLDITNRASAAYKAKIPRGAKLLDLRRHSGGYVVIYSHLNKAHHKVIRVN